MSWNNINGTFPYHLGNLSMLEYLDLSNNADMTGDNFEWLARLSSLRVLSLSFVNLSKAENWVEERMSSSFQKLCRLKILDLKSNALSVPVDDILQNLGCATKSLQELRLSDNQLTGLCPDFSEFESLRVLDVSHNQLTGPLPDFKRLSTLVELRMNYNSLNGSLPKSVAKLSDLTVLDLSSNSLHGFISEAHLSTLSKLQELGFSNNSFTFTSSSNWVPPFRLKVIELRSCKLGPDFPRWIQTQENLSWLDISNSQISDVIPIWIWNFSSTITYLNLSFNHIYGQIPNLPMEFSNLPAVDLSYNSFHGPIPQFLSQTASLNLATNEFSGTLSFLCSATSGSWMAFLDLSDNQLSGGLTDCWVQLTQLQIVNLEDNNLSGAIPSSIGSLNSLETLRLRKNNFVGELPSSLQNCIQLKLLDVGENKLSGHVPTWIGESLTNLVVLSLRSNKFYGNIPSKMCHLSSLRILDLAFNNISGSIPTCLNNLTAMVSTQVLLSTLSGWYNSAGQSDGDGMFSMFKAIYVVYTSIFWKGVEQTYGRTIGLLRIIDLSSNNLIGDIPSEVTELLGLISLNLSRNNLGGIIPESIGQLQKLEVLDLSHNKLFGKIPSGLAAMTFLDKLDLSNNNLTGRIPTGTQLQSFNASSYLGNIGLCGCPLPIKCAGDSNECLDDKRRQEATAPVGITNNTKENDGFFDRSSLYAGMGVGFAAGLSGFCCLLTVNGSWRQGYVGFLNKMGNWLYLFMELKIARRGFNAAS